jgi:hypothetical protein
MADVDLVVMVEENRRADMDQLARALEAKGLRIKEKLPRFRMITGTADKSVTQALQSVEGVETVRPQEKYQLPPMDEKIPQ